MYHDDKLALAIAGSGLIRSHSRILIKGVRNTHGAALIV